MESGKEVVKKDNLKNVARMPTSKNMDMYQLYLCGYKLREIGELYDISIQAVTAHLNRVSAYYENDWRTLQLNRVKSKVNRVLESQDRLIAKDDSKTVNKFLDRLVYPDKNSSQPNRLQFNFIADRLQIGTFDKQSGQPVNAESEVIEDG